VLVRPASDPSNARRASSRRCHGAAGRYSAPLVTNVTDAGSPSPPCAHPPRLCALERCWRSAAWRHDERVRVGLVGRAWQGRTANDFTAKTRRAQREELSARWKWLGLVVSKAATPAAAGGPRGVPHHQWEAARGGGDAGQGRHPRPTIGQARRLRSQEASQVGNLRYWHAGSVPYGEGAPVPAAGGGGSSRDSDPAPMSSRQTCPAGLRSE